VIHVAFTHLALTVGDITRLEYLVSHTYLVTSFAFIGLDDGSCCTLPGKMCFTSGSGDSFYVCKNVGDDRRLLYIGSCLEILNMKNSQEFIREVSYFMPLILVLLILCLFL